MNMNGQSVVIVGGVGFERLRNEGPLCPTCPNYLIGERRVAHDGRGNSGILILGDSPWKDEVKQGKPFAGAAGSYLDKLIRQLGRRREDFHITNSMWCRPQSLNWTDKEEAQPTIDHCSPYLDELIARVKPKVIIPMGNVALRRACGVTGILTRQAYVHESVFGVPAVPTFHPSFLMQNNHKFLGAAAYAFRIAEEIARTSEFRRKPVEYLIDPPLDGLDSYVARFGPQTPLTIDLETPMSSELDEEQAEEEDTSYTIVRVSFSLAPLTAVTIPWSEPYIGWLRRMLPTRPTLIMHNANFDEPRLRAQGIEMTHDILDTMWMWHWLQSDLPKSLGFVAPFFSDLAPWKHLSQSDLPFYSAVDSDATYRCYVGIRQALEKQGRWEPFVTHCLRTGKVLKRMGAKGVLVHEERQAALRVKLEAEYEVALEQLQSEIPVDVRRLKTWKKGPKVVTEHHIIDVQVCPSCGGTGAPSPQAQS